MNVYVMSSTVEALLSPESIPLIQEYRNNRCRWEVVHNALPLGHHITGAYIYRGAVSPSELEPSFPDFVGGSRIAPRRAPNILSPERQRIQAMKKADVGFLWLGGAVYTEMLADAAMLYGTGKEVVVASPSEAELQKYPLLVEMMFQKAYICQDGQKVAYERAMADIEVHVQNRFVLMTSKYGGLCRGCGGPYHNGEPIMWSRNEGVYHKDCYDAMVDPSKANPALYNADLVNALRTKNNELERECTTLMARVSELERLHGKGS